MSAVIRKLPRSFYVRDVTVVAQDLLGKFLVRREAKGEQIGRIVETEGYLGPHDLASHSSRGLTQRNAVLFGPPGHAYVYLIYGMYYCFNVVAEQEGKGAAVLIRALEPIKNCPGKTTGPGLLCRSLHLTRAHNGCDLRGDELFLALPTAPTAPFSIVARPRIGVDYAGPWARRRLRFYIKGSRYVSKK